MQDRIDVEEAQRRVTSAQAKLICAYEDESKCDRIRLEGGISLRELEAREAFMPASTELIFYCAWPAEGTSASVADAYRQRGFVNAKALRGGVEAWQRAGYPMAAWGLFATVRVMH